VRHRTGFLNAYKRPQRDSKAEVVNADRSYRAASDRWTPWPTRQIANRTRPVATPGGRNEPKPDLGLEGVVEPALARALVLAAEAGRWEIVEQIARELKERRQGRQDTTPPVVVRLHRSIARP